MANKQLLSTVVANPLVLEVLGKTGQVAGLARLPTSSLDWGLAAGRPDSLVVAAEGLVKVVQEGTMVGLLQVGLLAGSLKQIEEVGGRRREPGVDRETMTCCVEETKTRGQQLQLVVM